MHCTTLKHYQVQVCVIRQVMFHMVRRRPGYYSIWSPMVQKAPVVYLKPLDSKGLGTLNASSTPSRRDVNNCPDTQYTSSGRVLLLAASTSHRASRGAAASTPTCCDAGRLDGKFRVPKPYAFRCHCLDVETHQRGHNEMHDIASHCILRMTTLFVDLSL